MKTIFCIIILAFGFGFTYSQELKEDSTLIHIETIKGNNFWGQITEEDQLKIVLKNKTFGKITIQKTDIKKRESIFTNSIKNGKYRFPNPQSSRYLWTPSSYGLKKGKGYYQIINTLWNHVSIGITDNLSVGVTIVPISIFNTTIFPIMLTPKVSIPIKENVFNIGFGALLGTVLAGDSDMYGLLYGTTTLGSPNNNISLGLFYGFSGNSWTKSPIPNFSFMTRVSHRGYLISENYFLPGKYTCLSLGGRTVWEKASLDYIGVIPLIRGTDSFIIVPVVSLIVPFGK